MSTGSFIPKNQTTRTYVPRKRNNLFVVSVIIYALFFAAPISSFAVYIYSVQTKKQAEATFNQLSLEVNSFAFDDLKEVKNFSDRTRYAEEILEQNFPMSLLLDIIEQNIPQTVSVTEFSMTRTTPATVGVALLVQSDSFDNAIFFRDSLVTKSFFTASSISELMYVDQTDNADGTQKLSYKIEISLPISSIKSYVPSEAASAFDSTLVEPEIFDEVSFEPSDSFVDSNEPTL
jgi:hypothetical protein